MTIIILSSRSAGAAVAARRRVTAAFASRIAAAQVLTFVPSTMIRQLQQQQQRGTRSIIQQQGTTRIVLPQHYLHNNHIHCHNHKSNSNHHSPKRHHFGRRYFGTRRSTELAAAASSSAPESTTTTTETTTTTTTVETSLESSSTLSSSSPPISTLGWETFEFSTAPKWDVRFDDDDNSNNINDNNNDDDGSMEKKKKIKNKHPVSNTTTLMLHQQVSPEEWEQIVQDEREKDEALSRKLAQQHAALQAIDPALIQRAVDVLSKVVRPDRLERISNILQQRTRHVRFLFENPANPSNVWACLRTLDSFGIQHVGIIMDPTYYEQGGGKAAMVQKRGMRTAMGSAQWMTVHHYLTTTQAIRHVRDQLGFCIVASDVHDGAHDIRKLPWNQLSLLRHSSSSSSSSTATTTEASAASATKSESTCSNPPSLPLPLPPPPPPPICIVMGNEGRGISEEMRQACDATFYLPMSGFAESFNLSVATAITCAHLSAASQQDSSTSCTSSATNQSLLRSGDLDPHEYNCLLLKGLLYSFAQKRTGHALLRKEGIVLPPEINWI